jgi:hypothetical protein
MKWAGCVACIGKMRYAYVISVGRPRRRLEDNIRMNFGDTLLKAVNWMYQKKDSLWAFVTRS